MVGGQGENCACIRYRIRDDIRYVYHVPAYTWCQDLDEHTLLSAEGGEPSAVVLDRKIHCKRRRKWN